MGDAGTDGAHDPEGAQDPGGAAFGAPGIAPTWCSSDKDFVTTALGGSRLWATIGHGIINEVYWPSTGAAADARLRVLPGRRRSLDRL